mmetsp:Transcript_1777/g.4107  ORF Transcript_1777/g.4107 Transcript_1777/m.4107 type:complete len:750 (-) Transcript_1777:52-2301(-)
MATTENNSREADKQRRRKKRWGSAADASNGTAPAAKADPGADVIGGVGSNSVKPNPSTVSAPGSAMDRMAKIAAIQESARARLAAIKAQRQQQQGAAPLAAASAAPSILKRPASSSEQNASSTPENPPVKRAKHYELDMSITGPTFRSQQQQQQDKPKQTINPYLAHRQQEQQQQQQQTDASVAAAAGNDSNANTCAAPSAGAEEKALIYESNVDGRLAESVLAQSLDRRRRGRKQLSFVEPGTFVKIAERKRQKAANAAEAGFISGRKSGQYVQSTTIMANIYGKSSEERLVDNETDRLVDPNRLPARQEAGVSFGSLVTSSSPSSSGPAQDDKPGSDRKANKVPHVVEWWDMELLPSKLKKQVATFEGKALSQETQSQMKLFGSTKPKSTDSEQDAVVTADGDDNRDQLTSPEAVELREKCSKMASLSYSKTAELIQHIVPIKPANAAIPTEEVQPVLHLTKKELKRQRKLRRQEKQREMQDLQAAGLIPPPEPRLTLQNFIRVLGDQAYADPSQMEQKVQEQIQARQKAHIERNESRKLTKEQRKEKRARKLQEDTSTTGIHVALFYVKDMSHPYHRAKVDLNAQQFNLSGGVVECLSPQISCVIVEGGPKAVKKYIRLMNVRMKWTGTDDDDDDDDDDDEEDEGDQVIGDDGNVVPKRKKNRFNKDNKCDLVWTGIATKRFFKGFVFQACETSDEAGKILRAKGVGHFWEQILTHASGSGESFHLKLADDSDDDHEDSDKMEVDG